MTLPIELVLAIANQLDHDHFRTEFRNADIRSMRLVCSAWANALSPLLWNQSKLALFSIESVAAVRSQGASLLNKVLHLEIGENGRTTPWSSEDARLCPRAAWLPVLFECKNLQTFDGTLMPPQPTSHGSVNSAQKQLSLAKVTIRSVSHTHDSFVNTCVELLSRTPNVKEVVLQNAVDCDERLHTMDEVTAQSKVDLPMLRTLSFRNGAEIPFWPNVLPCIFTEKSLRRVTSLTCFEHLSILDHTKLCSLFSNIESFQVWGYGLGYEVIDDLETNLSDFARFPKLRVLSFDPKAEVWPFVTLETVLSPELPPTIERIVFNISLDARVGKPFDLSSFDSRRNSALKEIIMHEAADWYAHLREDSELRDKNLQAYREAKMFLRPFGIAVKVLGENDRDLLA